MSDTSYSVVHDESAQRFVVTEDGAAAELNYRLAGDVLTITHIGVPHALDRRGIGSALAQAGLEYARQQGLTVVPLCWFARSYIDRTPEYQSLVRQ